MGRELNQLPATAHRVRLLRVAAGMLGMTLLAGCGSGGEPDATTGAGQDPAGPAAEAQGEAQDEATSSPEPAPTSGTEPDAPGPDPEPGPEAPGSTWADEADPDLRTAGCVVGTWVSDNERMSEEYARVMGGTGLTAMTVEVTGELLLHLGADASYSAVATANRHEITGSSDGMDISYAIQHDGTDVGTWSYDGTHLVIDATGSEGVATVADMVVGGMTMPMGELPGTGQPWSGDLDVVCEAEWMSVVDATEPDPILVYFDRVG